MYRIGSLLGVTAARNLRTAAAVAGAAAAVLDAAAIILQDASSPPQAGGRAVDPWDFEPVRQPLRVVTGPERVEPGSAHTEAAPRPARPAMRRPAGPIEEARAHLTAMSQLPPVADVQPRRGSVVPARRSPMRLPHPRPLS